ncbi:MAG: aldo/keto reductase [Chloroflexota bacterium]
MSSTNEQSTLHTLQLPIGLGLAALGRPGYITLGHGDDLNGRYSVEAMESHAHQVLDMAWAGGIRYFDAARSYGQAEAFLGSWLQKRQRAPNDVTIGSKWGYTYTASWQVSLAPGEKHEVKEHSLPVLERQLAESRAILGTHLNLYQIHSATLESGVLANQSVLSRLAELRNDGLVVGLSVSGAEQAIIIEEALQIEFDSQPLFGAVQATWNLLEQSTAPALETASNRGLVIIIKEVLANGRLTDRNNAPDFANQRMLLEESANKLQTSVDALAIAAALHQPWATIVLSGAAQVQHL